MTTELKMNVGAPRNFSYGNVKYLETRYVIPLMYDSDDEPLMTSVVQKISKHEFKVQPEFYKLTLKISNYRDNELDKYGDNKHTLYIANDDYWSLITGDIKKEKYRNEKGEKRVYKRISKGIYIHGKKSILAPTFLNALVKHNDMKPSASIDEHISSLRNDIKQNHTGNHYRNKYNSVPPPPSGR